MTTSKLNLNQDFTDFIKETYGYDADDFEYADDNDRSNYREVYYQQDITDPVGTLPEYDSTGYDLVVDFIADREGLSRDEIEQAFEEWKRSKNKARI